MSAKPPRTRTRRPLPGVLVITRNPVLRAVITGEWPARTVMSPSVAGSTTASTSPENSTRSGETSSKVKVAIGAPRQPDRRSGVVWEIRLDTIIPERASTAPGWHGVRSGGFGREALGLLDRFL